MNCVCWSLEEQPTNNHKLNSRHSWNISSDWIPQPQGEVGVLSWTYYLPIRSWLLIFIIINCILLSYIYVWFIVLQLEHNKPVVSFVGLREKNILRKANKAAVTVVFLQFWVTWNVLQLIFPLVHIIFKIRFKNTTHTISSNEMEHTKLYLIWLLDWQLLFKRQLLQFLRVLCALLYICHAL